MAPNWSLQGKTALVTGGSKGIGKATVEEFLSLGAEVVFTARQEQEVSALEKVLRESHGPVYGLAADVTNAADISRLMAFVEKQWGKLDILVNNAGTNIRKATGQYTEEEYQLVIATNVTAPYRMCIAALELLKKSGNASVVNVASVAGMVDVQTGSPYGISKGGLLQFTRNTAAEWASFNIRVNTVSPWFTETPLTEGLLSNEARMNSILERTPMKRIAKAQEMATAIAFLAMPASSYITGHNLVVDGGMTISAF
jgi:Tropinone reductase 1